MRMGLALLASSALVLGAGCHSAYVDAVVSNRTDKPVTLVELDYPSASFGTQTLAPGADFRYRFKILGSGDTKLLWTDADHHDHTVAGPSLKEGQEGPFVVTIQPSGVTWAPSFKQ